MIPSPLALRFYPTFFYSPKEERTLTKNCGQPFYPASEQASRIFSKPADKPITATEGKNICNRERKK